MWIFHATPHSFQGELGQIGADVVAQGYPRASFRRRCFGFDFRRDGTCSGRFLLLDGYSFAHFLATFGWNFQRYLRWLSLTNGGTWNLDFRRFCCRRCRSGFGWRWFNLDRNALLCGELGCASAWTGQAA